MLYRELKKLLIDYGFKLEWVQTSGNLDMLEFIHPNIKGVIVVDFDYDFELPEDVNNGREFSYDEDWILEAPIQSIDFDIDVSIAFLSDDVLDTYGSENMNKISLFGEDIELAKQVLDIVTDPYGIVNFMETYANKQLEFLNIIKKFLPVLKKYGLTPQPQKRSGDESSLYTSLSMCFIYDGNNSCIVDFSMRVLNWKKELLIAVEPGFLTEYSEQSIEISVEDFETELCRQIEIYDTIYPQIKDHIKNN
jgi:hypothetical protein